MVHLFSILLFFTSWGQSIFQFFHQLGALGLFLLGALDSSFLFLPFGNDLLLIAFVSSNRNSLVWILYVVVSAFGSLLGVFIVDLFMRKAGEKGLERFLKPERIKKLKKRLDKRAGWFIFGATILPPPFPFTPVVMATSALQCSRSTLFLAVFTGRLVRFTIEALLAIYFGRRIVRLLDSPMIDYVIYGFIAIAVVGSVFSILKWVRKPKAPKRKKKKAA